MATTLQIRVKPRAGGSSLALLPDGTWVAKLRSPPVDGKANEELVGLVARHFGCRRADVAIKSGATGRTKIVTISS